MARFTKSQCQPCPARTQCTTSRESTRTVGFPPRELRDLQLRVRTEQQTPEWKTRYAVRSGVEGTRLTSSPTAMTCDAAATEDRGRPTSSTS
ncbi:transposase [Streptomyces sp. NBC_00365]|uniref:transposase n=1 Tax=Streptomyces sp. NBC_00365 TaxID=2975726 RepID=UPI00225110F4|nr:transposase [Streptomyces sp. NBC_00365]MCX5093850.1 transposase [Streptomyces sp. NBC_00365]